jgi:excisionase family DNA binding protein
MIKQNNSNKKEPSELLTLNEACEILRVHPNTMRNWDKKGILKSVRIGERKIRRYKKEELINFIEESK